MEPFNELKDIMGRQLAKFIVGRKIFCGCGNILDIDDALIVDVKRPPARTLVVCGRCRQGIVERFAASGINFNTAAAGAAKKGIIEILWDPCRGEKTEPAIIRWEVENRQTGEKTIVEMPEDEAKDVLCDGVSICCGPCEHDIEPDGICPDGWPSRQEIFLTGREID